MTSTPIRSRIYKKTKLIIANPHFNLPEKVWFDQPILKFILSNKFAVNSVATKECNLPYSKSRLN